MALPIDTKQPLIASFSSQGTDSSEVPYLHKENSLNAYYPEDNDYRKSSSFIKFFFKSFNGGSLTVGILSLIAATIGTGGLMISQAMAASGVAWSVIQVLICSWMSYVTLIALVKCAHDTNSRSYQEIVAVTFGGWFKHVFNFCCFFANWGSAIIYLQQSAELLATVANSLDRNLPDWITNPDSQILTLILATVFMLPLALPRELSGLKYFTFVNLIIILLMCYAVIYEAFAYQPISVSWETTKMFIISGFSTTFPTIIFSVTSHPNVIDVFIELKTPTLKKMRTVIIWTMIFTIISYTVVGILGYATFSGDLNILNNENMANGVILVAYGYDVQTGGTSPYPMIIMISMITTCFSILISQSFNLKPAKDSLRSSARTMLKKFGLSQSDDESDQESMVEQFIYVFVTLYSCVLVALFSDSIQLIMNILGSSFFSLLCFIFPSMLYLKTYYSNLSKYEKGLHWFMIIVNAIFLVWNTYKNIQEAI